MNLIVKCFTVGCVKKQKSKTLLGQLPTLSTRVKSFGSYRGIGETSHQGQTDLLGKRFIEAHSSYRVNLNSWLYYSLPAKSHNLVTKFVHFK